MKKSDHKVTFVDALAMLELSEAGLNAVQLGEQCWPDKARYGPSRGGPSSSTVSAAYMLGKLRARGLVICCGDDRNRPGSYQRYVATAAGRKYMQDGQK